MAYIETISDHNYLILLSIRIPSNTDGAKLLSAPEKLIYLMKFISAT
jgi:hypothetical protein